MKPKLFTRDFTLLLLGQVSSLFGNFILRLALSMYVLEATGSAAAFAGILSLSAVPAILLSPFGGVLADRVNRRNLMAALDALAGFSVLCAVLLFPAGSGLTVITALLVILAVLGAFETPVVQACIPSMLTGEQITKGNAVVNQAASVSCFVGPILGGMLYAAFGLKPVMGASIACFFLTALLECFIRLHQERPAAHAGGFSAVGQDLLTGIRFLCREQVGILQMLLAVAVSRFFVMGVTEIGLPYLVRQTLGLDARYYGAAESALAVATISGSIAAGLLAGRFRPHRLARLLSSLGLWLLPAGLVFLLPAGAFVKYIVITVSFCGMQAAAGIFSVFAVSLIQRGTPNQLLGRVMAYTSAVTLCVQPVGQIVYGVLFDRFSGAVSLVLLPTAALLFATGRGASCIFQKLGNMPFGGNGPFAA